MESKNQQTLPDIRHTLVLNAPIQKVWDAVSTAEGIAAWFMPNDFQPIQGHEFSLHSPYGTSPCKVTELDPPNRLSFNWGEEWHITFELVDLEGKTEFTLIHSGWVAGKVMPQTGEDQAVIRDRMNNGWDSAVLPRLREFVEA